MKRSAKEGLKTKSANNWLESRETLNLVGYDGEAVSITKDVKCVVAVHTKRSTRKKNNRAEYTYGNSAKKYVVTENGYMISFDGDEPAIIGSKDDSGNIRIWGGTRGDSKVASTEYLYRVIWFSFALDAVEKGEQILNANVPIPENVSKEELRKVIIEYMKNPGKYEVHHRRGKKYSNKLKDLELDPVELHALLHKLSKAKNEAERQELLLQIEEYSEQNESLLIVADQTIAKNREGKEIGNLIGMDNISLTDNQITALWSLAIADELEKIKKDKGDDFFDIPRYVLLNMGTFFRWFCIEKGTNGIVGYRKTSLEEFEKIKGSGSADFDMAPINGHLEHVENKEVTEKQ